MPAALRIRLPASTEADFIARHREALSRGGIFLATRAPKPEGSVWAVELVLQGGERVLRAEAVVLKIRGGSTVENPAGAAGPAGPAGMMLRFQKLDARSKVLVERLARERLSGVPSDVDVTLEFTGEAPAPDAAMNVAAPIAPPSIAPVSPGETAAPAPVASPPRRRLSLELPVAEAPPAPTEGLGLQLGAHRLRIALVKDGVSSLLPLGNREALYLPAAVSLAQDGSRLVGWEASRSERAWYGWTRGLGLPAESALAQRLFSEAPHPLVPAEDGDVAWQVGGQTVSARQLTEALLREARSELTLQMGTPPLALVLAVPAHYGHRQRTALSQSAEAAGFRVLRLVQSTCAAALAVGHGRGLPRKRILVCDLHTAGADAAVVELTGNDLELVTSMGSPGPTRTAEVSPEAQGEALAEALALTRSTLQEAGLLPQGLDEVLLAGAVAGTQQVREQWQSALGKEPMRDFEVEGVATRGAALLAHALTRTGSGPAFATATEVLTRTLELAIEGRGVQRLFERRTHLPAEKTVELALEEGQTLRFALLQRRAPEETAAQLERVGLVTLQAERRGTFTLRLALDASGCVRISVQPPAGLAVRPLSLDASAAIPPELLQELPLPPEAQVPQKGFLGGIRKLWKRG